jgi:hypothetical protein
MSSFPPAYTSVPFSAADLWKVSKEATNEKETSLSSIFHCAAVLAEDRCCLMHVRRPGHCCSSERPRYRNCRTVRHRQSRQHGRCKGSISSECVRSRVAHGGGIPCCRGWSEQLQPGRSLGGEPQFDRGRQHHSGRFPDGSSKRNLRSWRCYC